MSEVEDEAVHLPPPSFHLLVYTMVERAALFLGLLRLQNQEEQPKPNLELARHEIDMLAMLQEKTKGNLTLEEQRYLENSLTELRFRYVQATESQPA